MEEKGLITYRGVKFERGAVYTIKEIVCDLFDGEQITERDIISRFLKSGFKVIYASRSKPRKDLIEHVIDIQKAAGFKAKQNNPNFKVLDLNAPSIFLGLNDSLNEITNQAYLSNRKPDLILLNYLDDFLYDKTEFSILKMKHWMMRKATLYDCTVITTLGSYSKNKFDDGINLWCSEDMPDYLLDLSKCGEQ